MEMTNEELTEIVRTLITSDMTQKLAIVSLQERLKKLEDKIVTHELNNLILGAEWR